MVRVSLQVVAIQYCFIFNIQWILGLGDGQGIFIPMQYHTASFRSYPKLQTKCGLLILHLGHLCWESALVIKA